jgi:hypothetical protein
VTVPVDLPALDGRDPLGFLAALGLLHLITNDCGPDTRLAFSDTTATAALHSRLASLDDIAQTLARIAGRAHPDGAIPDLDPAFPLAKPRRTRDPGQPKTDERDPMRVPRDRYRDALADPVRALGHEEATTWLPALVTDLAVDNAGRAALTPFNAPSGQQSLRTFFDKPLAAVRREPSWLTEALAGWRRVDGYTGEYLDHRVLRSAADHPSGASVEAGVPGATWLATMALPLLRLTGDGQHVRAALWHRAGRRSLMVWPLWRQPLDLPAVRVLLEHPALRPTDQRTVAREPLTPLGVFDVCGAERQPIAGRNSAGVLAPTTIPTPPATPSGAGALTSSP